MEPMDTDTDAVAPAPATGPLVALGAPSADSGAFSWTVQGWSTLHDKKLTSDVFTIAGRKWRLLLFPAGNNDAASHVSLYLDSSPEPTEMSFYDACHFTLELHGHSDEPSVRKDSSHRFTPDKPDWGFTNFVPLPELRDPARCLVKDDAVTVSVEARIVHETNWLTYDSKKETGFVGLKNQGATCYMNSLLQTLFHIPFFRKAVYHMPTTEADRPEKSIPLALQALFYKMQFGEAACSTKDLTKSFGWDTAESFQQHDVQELNRVLCDKLEEKMKGTSVEGTMAALFEGKTATYIACTDVAYASTKRESFLDLQLDVKGCRDVTASFEKYVEEERLEGDNQYHAEGFGLQNARKGIRFLEFPPVLQLQLKRFEYDYVRDMMGKIHDRYEFPQELDLSRFLHTPPPVAGEPPPPPPQGAHYVLHSVLVHSGGLNSGHYYAFCRIGGEWFRFDDERVTREDATKAVDDNYGESTDDDAVQGKPYAPPWKIGRLSSAYMLVYVRASDLDKMVCPVAETDIPEHVRERLALEAAEKARLEKEKAEAHLYTVVRCARDDDIAARVCARGLAAFDLVDHDTVTSIRVERGAPFSTFKELAAQQLGVPVAQQRWWLWAKRQNGTFRPSRLVTPAEESQPVSTIHEQLTTPLLSYGYGTHNSKKDSLDSLQLLLETPWPPPAAGAPPPVQSPPPSKTDILLFFKLYDPVAESLAYLGRAFAAAGTKIGDLHALVAPLARLLPTDELLFFEEIKFDPVMVEPLDKKDTLKTANLENGDIIVVQRVLPAADMTPVRFACAPEFFGFVRNRLVITFRELEAKSRDAFFTLELSRSSSYDDVAAALAAHLSLPDPQLLRLTAQNTLTGAPKPAALRFRERDTLLELLTHFGGAVADTLFYEVLDMPLPQLEGLKTLKVDWFDDRVDCVKQLTLRLPKSSSVGQALAVLREQLTPADLLSASSDTTVTPAVEPQLRLMEVSHASKIYKIFSADESVEFINNSYWRLRAEAVPPDQADGCVGHGERLVNCCHVRQDTSGVGIAANAVAFGEPFLLKVRDDEPLSSVKARVAAKLGVQDAADFATWKWAVVTLGRPDYFETDADRVGSRFGVRTSRDTLCGAFETYLGMEHEDKRPKRAVAAANRAASIYDNRPIKIHG